MGNWKGWKIIMKCLYELIGLILLVGVNVGFALLYAHNAGLLAFSVYTGITCSCLYFGGRIISELEMRR